MQTRHVALFSLLVLAGWLHHAAASDEEPVAEPAAVLAVTEPPAALDVAPTADPSTLADPAAVQAEIATGKPPMGKPPMPLPGSGAGGQPYCGVKSTGNCEDVKTPKAVACNVGAAMQYTGSRFLPKDFVHSCLGDASVACNDPKNTANPATMTAASSCCSCYLYSQIFNGQYHDLNTQLKHKYVTNQPKLDPANKVFHLLVMPKTPCTGVENWNDKTSCPGEEVWSAAKEVIDRDIKPDNPYFGLWAIAINPVERRGQHQMHLHVSQVYQTLLSSMVYTHFKHPSLTSFQLQCGTSTPSTPRLNDCDYTTGSSVSNLQVTIVKGSTPGDGNPFATAYPPPLNNQQKPPNVLKASTLVLRVPWTQDSWAVIVNPVGPAECFFNHNGQCDLIKACNALPGDCPIWWPCQTAPTSKTDPACNNLQPCFVEMQKSPAGCTVWKPCANLPAECHVYQTVCGFTDQKGKLC